MKPSVFIAVFLWLTVWVHAGEINLNGVNLNVLKKDYPERTIKAILKQNFWYLSTELTPGKTAPLETLHRINAMTMDAAGSYPDVRKDDLWRKSFVNSLFMIFMNEKQSFDESLKLYISWMDCLRTGEVDGWTHMQESMALVQLGTWLLTRVPLDDEESAWKIIFLTDTRSGDFPRNEVIISWAFAKRKFLLSQYRALMEGRLTNEKQAKLEKIFPEQLDTFLSDERLPIDFRANTLDEFARLLYSSAHFDMATRIIEKHSNLSRMPAIMNLRFCIRLYGHADMHGAREIFSEMEKKVKDGELAKDDNCYSGN